MKIVSLILSLFLYGYGFSQSTSYDSTRQLLIVSAQGNDVKNIKIRGQLRPATDTFKMAVSDSGSVVTKNSVLYVWNGYKWIGSVTAGNAGDSSIHKYDLKLTDNRVLNGNNKTLLFNNLSNFTVRTPSTPAQGLLNIDNNGTVRIGGYEGVGVTNINVDNNTGVVGVNGTSFQVSDDVKLYNPATGKKLKQLYYDPTTKSVSVADTSTLSFDFWKLNGNAGTTFPTNFIGTTDQKPLLFKVANGYGGIVEGSYSGSRGYGNTGLGGGTFSTLLSFDAAGTRNTAIGYQSAFTLSTGSYNSFLGGSTATLLTTGSNNVAIGNNSLNSTTTGSSNIAIGYYAGSKNSTQSNQLFINNQNRSSYANDTALSLVYGIMDASTSNQRLKINGRFSVNDGTQGAGKVFTSDAAGIGTWQTPTSGTVTSVATGNGLSGGPITSSGTISADTSILKTVLDAYGDSLALRSAINSNATSLALKVNISDTSSMLTPYRNGINSNTAATSLKVNISDTSAMLLAYRNAINTKQNTLVSGTNIKTINGTTLLGSGDLVISGGGGADSAITKNDLKATGNRIIDWNNYNYTFDNAKKATFIQDTVRIMGRTSTVPITSSVTIEYIQATPALVADGSCYEFLDIGSCDCLASPDNVTTFGYALSLNHPGYAALYANPYLDFDYRQKSLLGKDTSFVSMPVGGAGSYFGSKIFIIKIYNTYAGKMSVYDNVTGLTKNITKLTAGDTTQIPFTGAAATNRNRFTIYKEPNSVTSNSNVLLNAKTLDVSDIVTGFPVMVGDTLKIKAGSAGTTRSIQSISTATTGGATALTDYVYFISGITTYTQPTAVGNTNSYTLKNTGTAIVTVLFTGGQTGDGDTTITLAPGSSITLYSNGTNWFIT